MTRSSADPLQSMQAEKRPMTVTLQDLFAQLREDVSVLSALDGAGADFDKEHDVEHFFVAEDKARLADLAELLEPLGYQPDEPDEIEGKYGVRVVSRQAIDVHRLLRETILMRLVGEVLGISYDGWGAAAES